MEYVTMSPEKMAWLLRRHLVQAEEDHYTHSLKVEEAQAELDNMPAPKPDDTVALEAVKAAEAEVALLTSLADAAETKAVLVKLRLDDLEQPYVEPVPAEADQEA